MLNHDIPDFKFVARESLKRDMAKRGVPISNLPINFLGYAVENNGCLNPTTKFGGLSDWLANKLVFLYILGMVKHNGEYHKGNVKKVLYDHILVKRVAKAKTLNMQGNFLSLEDIEHNSL